MPKNITLNSTHSFIMKVPNKREFMNLYKKCKTTMILTEKQQKSQHYHQEKLLNMNILQVKEYCLLIKDK